MVATCDDLLCSALTVHFHEKESYGVKLSALAAYLFCAAATTFLMSFERRTDDAGVVTFFILAMTFVLGCIHPRRARLWSLAGLCVPAAHFHGALIRKKPMGLQGYSGGRTAARLAPAAAPARRSRTGTARKRKSS